MTATIDPAASITTSYTYDALNRQVSETDAVGTPVQRTTTTVYDAADNIIATTDGRGLTTSYTYDAAESTGAPSSTRSMRRRPPFTTPWAT